MTQINDARCAGALSESQSSLEKHLGWLEFIAAWLFFLISHAIPVRAPTRPWLEARLGQRGFLLAYSLLSLLMLTWLIGAAGRAPFIPLWADAPWQNYVVVVAMLVACLIVTLTLGRPNPFSFGGPDNGFDPARAGVVRWMRHPLLCALAVWAAAHGVANDTLAHGVMFFGFAAFALYGMVLIDRRRQARMGPQWTVLWKATRAAPAGAILHETDALRGLGGIALWAGLIAGHAALIGVSPWP